jgi:two-component system sensor histidine kinase VicK
MKELIQYFKGLQWKLLVIFSLLIMISLQLIGTYFIDELENLFIGDLKETLNRQARFLESFVKPVLENHDTEENVQKELRDILHSLVVITTKQGVDIEILDHTGYVLGALQEEKIGTKNIRVFSDLSRSPDHNIRRDPTTNQDYLIYIKPLKNESNQLLGYIYMEASLNPIYDKIKEIIYSFIKSTAIMLIATGLLIFLLTNTITTPIKEITRQATAMAEGDFNLRVTAKSEDEIGQLAKAFNHLAAHLQEALSQKEVEKEKLETVIANMSDGVLATDTQGNIIVKNKRAEKLLDQQITIGQSIFSLLSLKDKISFPLDKEEQTYLEFYPEDPEQHTIIKVTLIPIKHLSNKTVGSIVVLRDVTESEKLDRQRKDFVANVSHELRTPLTTIKSYLEALEDGAVHQPELATRFLRVTIQEAERMTRLIQDLLQLSRLDAKKSYFNKKKLVLKEMLEDVVDRFSVQCKQKQIQLDFVFDSKVPPVFADRDKLDQVLDNLISNAVKYTPNGGKITVSAYRNPDGWAEISVADNGIGIPKKDLGRIFERFYRVDKARSRSLGGTGLGLAIAQEIVHAHDGKIWIESEYQKGTTVYFTLPPYSEVASSCIKNGSNQQKP